MDQLLEVTNVKNESTDLTSNNRLEIPAGMNMNSVKQESDCIVQSKIYIKTEPQENESIVPIIEDTSYKMRSYNNIKFTTIKIEYEDQEKHIMQNPLDVGNEIKGISYQLSPNYNMTIKTDEPIINIKCKDLMDELVKDPLNVDSAVKVKEHIPNNLDQGESGIKTEPTGEDKEILLDTVNDNSHGCKSNQFQNQLLVGNEVHKSKKHICHICSKIFTQKARLNDHLRIHTGEKPFTCNICKKSFTLKNTLDRHMLIHSGEKPHTCDVCSKVFRQKSSLDEHKLIHNDIKPFFCNECDKSFPRKHYLIRHQRIHTGDKPYACNICDKAFIQKGDLTKHTQTHTGEKPFCCDICYISFSRKSNLNRHKKIHNN